MENIKGVLQKYFAQLVRLASTKVLENRRAHRVPQESGKIQ
jgi:hypothetical protein